MKKNLLTYALLIPFFGFSQTINELKNELDKIKVEITDLKSEIQSVKSQNIYLKKALDINNPILEIKNIGNEYRVTKIVGNKKEKTISISMNIEAKDENKTSILQDFSIIDLVGNQYEIDLKKSANTNPNLTLNVPLNLKITFKEIIDEPKIIKLFKFRSRNEPERNSADFKRSVQEFKDLNITWE